MKITSLQYKLLMALTGLFLCFFLMIHLFGNFQLLLPAAKAQEQFNWYSHLLSGNIFIRIISWILYFCLISHSIYAICITKMNNKANATSYYYDRRKSSSSWNSRNMGLLGTIILFFLVIHFKDFWYLYRFTSITLDRNGNKDLYTLVITSFKELWYVVVYEISILALGFHLLHGFFSAARTLGLYHPKYVKAVRILGWIYTSMITVGFMTIPLYIYFAISIS